MVGTGKTLTAADVIEINRRMIAHFGGIFFAGDDNLANRGSLEYALTEIHGALYEQENPHSSVYFKKAFSYQLSALSLQPPVSGLDTPQRARLFDHQVSSL